MSLVLCKCRSAEQPFYIRSGKLNIYSLEELLFYAAGAVFIDRDDFMNADFTGWIRKNLENAELADELDKKLKSKAPLVDFFKPIEEASGYLSEVQAGKLNLSLNKLRKVSVHDVHFPLLYTKCTPNAVGQVSGFCQSN